MPQTNPRATDMILFEQMQDDMGNRMSRVDMERSHLFSSDSMREYGHSNKDNISQKHKYRNEGEITGHQYNKLEEERGMPLRGIMNGSNTQYIPSNPQLDFDLYDEEVESDSDNYDIKYNTPNNSLTFADVNEETMIQKQKSDPLEDFKYISNFLNFTLYNDLLKNKNKNKKLKYATSAYLIIEFLSSLFLGANGITEDLLRDVFGTLDRGELLNILSKNNQMLSTSQSIKFTSLYVLPDSLNLNSNVLKYINSYTNIILSNYKNTHNIQHLNNYFKKISGERVFPPDLQLRSRDLVAGQLVKFTPIFRFKPKKSEMINIKFIGTPNRIETLMTWNDKRFLSSGDNEHIMVEIDLIEPFLGMGFITRHDYDDIIMNRNVLGELLDNMKPKKFSKIQIPIFSQQFDFSLISQLQRLNFGGLKKCDLRNLSPSNYIKVKDLFQKIRIDVGPNGAHSHKESPTMTNRMDGNLVFKADHSFIYYVRFRPLNQIILMGIFN